MKRKSIQTAALKIMRQLNRRKSADNTNHCWNAASAAYAYASSKVTGRGKTDVGKAEAKLREARALCRKFARA